MILPSIAPIFIAVAVVLLQFAIKTFDLVVALTHGGPGIATTFPALFVYDVMFQRGQIAIGAAGSMMMLAALAVVLVPYALWMVGDRGGLPMVDATFDLALDPHARAADLRYVAGRIAVYGFLGFFAVIYLLPLFVIVANSFRDLPEIARNGLESRCRKPSRSTRGRRRGRTIASPAPAKGSSVIFTIP